MTGHGSGRFDVFVSYGHADQAWALTLATNLEAAGPRTFVEAWDIVPGDNRVSRLEAGVAGAIRAGNPVPNMTGTGAQGVVDPCDVAEVAVEALLTDEHGGAAHTLTGPELLGVPDQVAQLATELRRTITTVDVPPHAVRQQLVSAGFDPSVADSAVDGYQLVRDGGNAVVTDDVERILGRSARTFRAWARDHRTAFVAGEGHP